MAQSVTAAAAASGVELLMLDNRYDPAVAVRNAEEFVAKRVDLVLEFQVEEAAAPRVAHIFKKAEIPLVAIDVPHPNATYFGVDNFEVGYEAASILAQYAQRKWKGKVDRVVGVGFSEAGSFVQNRITGAFDGIRERFKDLTPDRFVQIEGRGMREASRKAMSELSARSGRPASIRWWPPPPIRARWAFWMRCARQGRKQNFAIVGQDCIPEVMEEMRSGIERDCRLDFARAGDLRTAADSARHFDSARVHRASLQLRAPPGGDAGDAGRRREGAKRNTRSREADVA